MDNGRVVQLHLESRRARPFRGRLLLLLRLGDAEHRSNGSVLGTAVAAVQPAGLQLGLLAHAIRDACDQPHQDASEDDPEVGAGPELPSVHREVRHRAAEQCAHEHRVDHPAVEHVRRTTAASDTVGRPVQLVVVQHAARDTDDRSEDPVPDEAPEEPVLHLIEPCCREGQRGDDRERVRQVRPGLVARIEGVLQHIPAIFARLALFAEPHHREHHPCE